MKPSLGIALAAVLTGLIVAAVAKTWDPRTERGTRERAQLTEKMRTVCVGRLLLDLPKEAKIELAGARIHGFDISAFDESREDFQSRLAQREEEIDSTPDRLGGNLNLELVKDVETGTGLVGKIFVHSRLVTEGTAGNGVENESFRYEGVAVEALVHGNGVSIDVSSEYYSANRIDNLDWLVSQLVPNPGNPLPRGRGFCIDQAYVRDPFKAEQREQITMFASLPSHPDIDFRMMLAAGVKPDKDGLLTRGDAAEAELPLMERFRMTRLRAAPRQIGSLSGEELVRRGIEANDALVYSFWWEVNGIQEDVFTPHLELTMNIGRSSDGAVQRSISEGAAIGLWDHILKSIRLRPAGQSNRSSAAPAVTAAR